MKGAFPPQRPALYAKVSYCFKNRVKRKSQTLLISFNVAPYFHLKKLVFFYLIPYKDKIFANALLSAESNSCFYNIED